MINFYLGIHVVLHAQKSGAAKSKRKGKDKGRKRKNMGRKIQTLYMEIVLDEK